MCIRGPLVMAQVTLPRSIPNGLIPQGVILTAAVFQAEGRISRGADLRLGNEAKVRTALRALCGRSQRSLR